MIPARRHGGRAGLFVPMQEHLTQEVIAEAMARAEKVACRPGDQRCYAFPNPNRGCPGEPHAKGAVSH
jgi:hypothetical protein